MSPRTCTYLHYCVVGLLFISTEVDSSPPKTIVSDAPNADATTVTWLDLRQEAVQNKLSKVYNDRISFKKLSEMFVRNLNKVFHLGPIEEETNTVPNQELSENRVRNFRLMLSKRIDSSKLRKDCQRGLQFSLWHRVLCMSLKRS